MCYTVEEKTNKRYGYKIVIKKGDSTYYKSVPSGVAVRVGKPNKQYKIAFDYGLLYNNEAVGRVVAYLYEKDATRACCNAYISGYHYILKIKLKGDVRLGIVEVRNSALIPIISGKEIVSFKEI